MSTWGPETGQLSWRALEPGRTAPPFSSCHCPRPHLWNGHDHSGYLLRLLWMLNSTQHAWHGVDTQSTSATVVITYCHCDLLGGIDGADEGLWTGSTELLKLDYSSFKGHPLPNTSPLQVHDSGQLPRDQLPAFCRAQASLILQKGVPSLCLILLEKSEQSLLFSVPRPWMCQASGSLPTSLSIAGSASNLTLFSQSAKTFRLFTLETNFPQLTQSYWLNNDFLPHLKVISVGIMTWRRKVNAFSVLLYEGQAVRVESHCSGQYLLVFPTCSQVFVRDQCKDPVRRLSKREQILIRDIKKPAFVWQRMSRLGQGRSSFVSKMDLRQEGGGWNGWRRSKGTK